jgi:flagellar biosynthesis protein FlhB
VVVVVVAVLVVVVVLKVVFVRPAFLYDIHMSKPEILYASVVWSVNLPG